MSAPDKKRRLPILQRETSADEPPEEDRPPWHWVGFAVVATFLVWLPLSALAGKLGSVLIARAEADLPVPRTGPVPLPAGTQISLAALQLVGFLIAAFAGGLLVGRFGGKAGPREGAVGGFIAALLACALAAVSTHGAGGAIWALLFVILGTLGSLAGWLGARFGQTRRHPAERIG